MRFKDSYLFRNLSLSILPVIYGFFYAFFTYKPEKTVYLIFAIVFSAFHIILIIYYCTHDKKMEPIRNCQKKLTAAEELLNATETIVSNNADFLYDKVHEKNTSHTEVKDIHFLQHKADIICQAVYQYIKATAETGQYFAVSVMFMERKITPAGETKQYQMVGRSTNYQRTPPKSLRKFISEEEAKGSFYHKIFSNIERSPYILIDKPSIEKAFKNPDAADFSQYIGIPIFCKDKICAILQIVAYKNSTIAKSESDIQLLCDHYLTLYANLFLLSDKVENICQLIN